MANSNPEGTGELVGSLVDVCCRSPRNFLMPDGMFFGIFPGGGGSMIVINVMIGGS